jgi:hypothetical protein
MEAIDRQPDDEVRGGQPLLLHSLSEFEELILECLDIVGAKSVVEIGAEEGLFTRRLLPWAEEHAATLHTVDPAPRPPLVELAAEVDAVDLIEERSLDALEKIEAADVYLIDGDHNYYTVLHELQTIDKRAAEREHPYLVLLHDVGWPSGRRDMYYAPDTLPADAVHPHTFDKGVVPEADSAVDGGFRGEGDFGWAVEEGGPENGVLTAVEDFVADRAGLELRIVPAVFGLGVLYPKDAPYAAKLRRHLSTYHQNPLLDRLERNRVTLFLRVLELQDAIGAVTRHRDDIELNLRDVEVQNRALWARNAELEHELLRRDRIIEPLEQLIREVDMLARSRAFSVAEHASHIAHLVGWSGTTLSAERLRDTLAAVEREK